MFNGNYRLRYLPLFYDDLYYVVIDDDPDDLIMEVRRFLYNGQNQRSLI